MIKMISNYATGDLLERAYRLAYFIHDDAETSLQIAVSAVAKLESAANIQARRILQRKSREKARIRRVSMGDLQLLQRLVYVESAPFEQRKENLNGALSEVDWAIRFVKHLVRITTKRSSFYVGVGICRFVFDFSTAEAMDIQSQLYAPLRDPDQYRRAKRLLLKEMTERFPTLHVESGYRGEERFVTDGSEIARATALRALEMFTPWGTTCAEFPEPGTSYETSISWDDESLEIRRFHHIIHPRCLRQVAKSAAGREPNVALPSFPDGSRTMSAPNDRLRLDGGLTADDKRKALECLADEVARRRVSLQ